MIRSYRNVGNNEIHKGSHYSFYSSHEVSCLPGNALEYPCQFIDLDTQGHFNRQLGGHQLHCEHKEHFSSTIDIRQAVTHYPQENNEKTEMRMNFLPGDCLVLAS